LAGAVTETETPRRARAVEPWRMPVLELIARVLDESGRPMRARHIHHSVQPLAGRLVPWSILDEYLPHIVQQTALRSSGGFVHRE
jgi:hypothetical protein